MIEQIAKRKTFGIVSHPDAGKTTLTEKLLLFGGAIQTAGAVKSNKIKKTATSDFMEIEKQRGISVATSVLAFEFNAKLINILDTPGHKDFAEDTYRTLTAVDSVILVIDCVKGVEEQTRKLMHVCRMRKTPVIVFINKLDRDGKDPFDLLDEIEEELNIDVRPLSWPINGGSDFKGVYLLYNHSLNLFNSNKTKKTSEEEQLKIKNIQDPLLDEIVGAEDAEKLREDVDLVEGVYEKFDKQLYIDGKLAPVFFGSALNNFGVDELLNTFVNIAPSPKSRNTNVRLVDPEEKKFSGFIFKIHANLDPKHRDRIAFLRVCSGKFERNKFYQHVRLNKKVRFNNPYNFLAQSKNVIDEAFPGDVVGLYDTGNFKIGDTLTEGEELFFKGMPSFSPEIFKEVINLDPMKSKQLKKGVEQLTDEGVAQLFTQQPGNRKFIGVVGELQFDVIKYRLEHEYGAKSRLDPLNYFKACWMTGDTSKIEDFCKYRHKDIVFDKDGNKVFLAQTAYILQMAKSNNPEITYHENSEFKLDNE
ncbi:MAG: peptide chain release factor 3 [Bacteroidetes bacterium MED-G17]|nr:MAG: peptide chain release factor 3 [Bacteroidetes bacterium MED-G17]|tara:strand:- start:2392 stop:3984 length:1593 start_codon:yes stop_codon:yes gene_type:complete